MCCVVYLEQIVLLFGSCDVVCDTTTTVVVVLLFGNVGVDI